MYKEDRAQHNKFVKILFFIFLGFITILLIMSLFVEENTLPGISFRNISQFISFIIAGSIGYMLNKHGDSMSFLNNQNKELVKNLGIEMLGALIVLLIFKYIPLFGELINMLVAFFNR